MKFSKYNILIENSTYNLIYNSLTGSILELNSDDNPCFNAIKDNNILGLSEKEQRELFSGGVLIDDDIDELDIIKIRYASQRFQSDCLGLTIAPTLACNFKCPYCYEIGKEGTTMDSDCEDALTKFIEANIRHRLNVTWYGGEPLLALNRIESITQKIKKIVTNDDCYTANIVTNGYYLTKDVAKILKKNGIQSAQVTIDGTRTTHNSRRITKSNEPTYDLLFKNIADACTEIDIVIRINLDYKNEGGMTEFYDSMNMYNLTDKIPFYIAKIQDNDNKNNYCEYLGLEKFSKCEMNVAKQKIEKGYAFSDIQVPVSSFSFCNATGPNMYVIDPMGNLYKCWHEIGDIKRSIGNIVKGISMNKAHTEWLLYEPFKRKACLNCKVLPLCMGGCPNQYFNHKKSCISTKYNINDMVNLFYLQNK